MVMHGSLTLEMNPLLDEHLSRAPLNPYARELCDVALAVSQACEGGLGGSCCDGIGNCWAHILIFSHHAAGRLLIKFSDHSRSGVDGFDTGRTAHSGRPIAVQAALGRSRGRRQPGC